MMSDTDIQQVESMKAGPLDLKLRKDAPSFSPEALRLMNSIGPGVFQGMDQGGKQTMNMVL
jgi:hypothetical protein